MATNYNPSVVTDGLVFCVDAGNSKSYPGSGTSWSSIDSTGVTGTIYGSPVFTSGNDAHFDFEQATADYVRFERNDLNGGSFAYTQITCELWYRPSSTGSTGTTGNNLITVENAFEISVGRVTGGHGIQYASNPWAWYGTNNPVLTDNEWNLISFVNTTSGRWIYVNGSQVFTRSDTGSINVGTTTYPYLTLMGRYSGTGSQAEGDLACVRLYNRGLSVAEITQNFEAHRGRFGV